MQTPPVRPGSKASGAAPATDAGAASGASKNVAPGAASSAPDVDEASFDGAQAGGLSGDAAQLQAAVIERAASIGNGFPALVPGRTFLEKDGQLIVPFEQSIARAAD